MECGGHLTAPKHCQRCNRTVEKAQLKYTQSILSTSQNTFSMCLGEKNNLELNIKNTKPMLSIGVKDKETNNSVLLKGMRNDPKVTASKSSVSFGNAASNLSVSFYFGGIL